jgi:RNA-directed DNA polymerase
MGALDKLKAATSRGDLAKLLDFTSANLAYILFALPPDRKYTTFQIPKRDGGSRTITAPTERLKLVQRKLSDLLQDCIEEINKKTGRKDRAAHGFKRGKSIITNARQHRRRRWVFNIDLEDFFPSIHFGRVKAFFIKNRDFALNEEVATTIARIACASAVLPQGSPCSPVISNLIASVLDVRLVRLAQAAGCTYSRYADDISFSTNKPVFPAAIASPASAATPHSWQPSAALDSAIVRAGFRVKASKTHMMYRDSRQGVTGLVVNAKVNIRSEYRRTVRAMVHHLITTGQFELEDPAVAGTSAAPGKRPGTVRELQGMLGFIELLDLFNAQLQGPLPPAELTKLLKHKEFPYLQFLVYSQFYAPPMPVVICEGDTDNVYLSHAILALRADYPELVVMKMTPKGNVPRLKIRLYKYSKSSTGRILGLNTGGTGNLAHFISIYREQAGGFTAPGMKHPVIVLFDNDSGADAVQGAVRKVINQPATAPSTLVAQNLYAVPTPNPAGATESTIEDFFDAATKAMPVAGKVFHAEGKGFDKAKHIGKQVFAHRVVRLNAGTINFDGFRPLLNNIVAVIKAHKPPPPHHRRPLPNEGPARRRPAR